MSTLQETNRVALIFGIILCISMTQAAKILILSPPVRSHLGQGISAGKILKEAGHEVWVLAPDQFTDLITKNGFHPLVFQSEVFDKYVDQQAAIMQSEMQQNPGKFPMNLANVAKNGLLPAMRGFCSDVLANATLMDIIKQENFDLVIKTTAFMLRCLYVIPYKYDIPFINVEAMDFPILTGVTGLPSFQPIPAIPGFALSNEMTFLERVTNTLVFYSLSFLLPWLDGGTFVDEYAPEKPQVSLNELSGKAIMNFVNVNIYCLDYPRVSAPNYHFLPGLTRADAKPLPQDLAEFVDSAEFGIIYVSFGSTAMGKTALEFILPDLFSIFSGMKQKAIVAIKTDSTFSVPDNVKLVKWAPQNDILGHPKCVLFIAHGGANGQMEVVYHGVPTIVIGFSDEMFYNGNRLQVHGMGLSIPIYDATKETLSNALHEVTENPSYREKSKQCADIIRDLPSGKDTFLLWTEHVLKFGGDHLRLSSTDMPTYSVLMFDVALFLVFVVAAIIFILVGLCYCTYRGCKECIKKEKTE